MSDINYYILDSIESKNDGSYVGHLNNETVEVFPYEGDESDVELANDGFAKCDAEGTETFLVEESSIEVKK